jgi:hypothetical protein
MASDSPTERRFFARVSGKDEVGCWLWDGTRNNRGYGMFRLNGKYVLVHRWSYEFFRTEIPAGLVIDHLCRNTLCVNPWHLEPVTNRENTLRGNHPMVVVSRNNVCLRGHSLDDAIILQNGPQKGRRNCRACSRERWAIWAADPEFRARRAAHERARRARVTEAKGST